MRLVPDFVQRGSGRRASRWPNAASDGGRTSMRQSGAGRRRAWPCRDASMTAWEQTVRTVGSARHHTAGRRSAPWRAGWRSRTFPSSAAGHRPRARRSRCRRTSTIPPKHSGDAGHRAAATRSVAGQPALVVRIPNTSAAAAPPPCARGPVPVLAGAAGRPAPVRQEPRADEQGGGDDHDQPGGQRQMPRGPPGPSLALRPHRGPPGNSRWPCRAAGGALAWLAYPPDAAAA